jgi:serine/threonine-protein kinase RsbW
MATVEVSFTPLAVHVRTARLVATAVARRSGVAESLLDEVRLAVGEACSRAVEAHQRHCPWQPIQVSLTDDGEQFQVVVTDAAPGSEHDLSAGVSLPAGIGADGGNGAVLGDGFALPAGGPVPLRLPDDVGLAVIAGLADDVRIASAAPGTSVTMIWKRRTAAF